MKLHIKSLISPLAVSAMIVTACSGNGGKGADAVADTVADADIRGQWYIENIVFSDSDYVRPDEAVPGDRQYVVFEDSTYMFRTNCNTLQGGYTVKGDSIAFGDGLMTEMACENMETEDALRRILPGIATVDVQNDSVIRLNGSNPAECILLVKAKLPVKCVAGE